MNFVPLVRRYGVSLLAAVMLLIPGESASAEVAVSAAISLKAALEKAQPELEKAAGDKIVFNFGASGTLENQIEQGAPVDLFLSADRLTAQKLLSAKEGGSGEKGTDQAFAGNEMVLIYSPLSSDAPPKSFADLVKVRRLAIGDPKIVPAGAYAKEVLTHEKLWDTLEKAGKLITTENVARVLMYVSRGDVEAGIVYASDAKSARNVQVVATADPSMHSTIEYVSVIVAGSKHRDAAKKLQQSLLSEKVQATFKDFGFTPPPLPMASSQPATQKQ